MQPYGDPDPEDPQLSSTWILTHRNGEKHVSYVKFLYSGPYVTQQQITNTLCQATVIRSLVGGIIFVKTRGLKKVQSAHVLRHSTILIFLKNQLMILFPFLMLINFLFQCFIYFIALFLVSQAECFIHSFFYLLFFLINAFKAIHFPLTTTLATSDGFGDVLISIPNVTLESSQMIRKLFSEHSKCLILNQN